jgi:2-keto-4-pentenoate hydratase/2-oxohepta-3-ene-1,7-dioic acid hydratase in catechol pathway
MAGPSTAPRPSRHSCRRHDRSSDAGAITLDVNGKRAQRRSVADGWTPLTLVAMLSRFVALRPGDLIFTGTPAGEISSTRRPARQPHRGLGNLLVTIG